MQLDFSPFYETCKEKGIKPSWIAKRDNIIDSTTLAKMKKGKNVELMTIAKICKYLDVPIEKIVRIKY